VIGPLLTAATFLTRLPLPSRGAQPRELAAAAACFPLVGFGIGAVGLALRHVCIGWLGNALTGSILLAYMALISGGLHLDGLADWFDAIGGGRGDRQRMLQIMRDPRIGAHGASALCIVLGAKLMALLELPPTAASLALLGAPVVARCTAVWLLWTLPSARSDGLGHALAAQLRLRHVAFATMCSCAGLYWFGAPALLPTLLGCGATALIGIWAQRRLGGATGDVHGAAIELSELAFMIGCARPW
jgi:adenosylcobinamide-GDP ribazoletransferase